VSAAPSTHRADAAELVRGVSPVVEVPFTDSGEVDFDGFRRVVQYVMDAGVSSMMFPGFASEFHKLSDAEKWELSQTLLELTNARPDVAAVVAVQDHATLLATRSAQRLVDAGADLINLLPPHFLGPSRDAVQAHVRAVLAAVDPTPVVLQYAPNQTGTSLDAPAIAAIARDHPNLRLVKVESNPPGTLIAALGEQDPPLPAVVGYAGVQLPDAVRRGAVGLQPGCSFTEIYVEIWRLFRAGQADAANDLHRRLLPYISYWMQGSELIVSAEKQVSFRRGLIGSAYCRAPRHELDAEELNMIERFLVEFDEYLPDLKG
jgi:dihydrodipicolinate synthase/N-acetylneuraminate lyase